MNKYCIVIYLLLFAFYTNAQLEINVDESGGKFDVKWNGVQWLKSSDFFVHFGSNFYSISNNKLIKTGETSNQGHDYYGEYVRRTISYKAGDYPVLLSYRTYTDKLTVVFEQEFPTGLNDTQLGGDRPEDELITCFPSFSKDPSVDGLNVLYYWEVMAQSRIKATLQEYKGGVSGGTPLILYDQSLSTIVVSPLQNYKVGYLTRPKNINTDIGSGIQGRVQNLPKNFKHETVLHAGKGLTKTVMEWGDILLKKSGKPRTTVESSDIAIKTLGYWTDNGAYYYYQIHNGTKNYEETIALLKADHVKMGLPFRNYQFDSWWYYQGEYQAVKEWRPRQDIFPSGMYKMSQITKTPLILHNRWWSTDNVYQKDYKFAVEEKMALPLTQDFWDDLMAEARSWGVTIYEQDWLITQMKGMHITQNNVHVARDWLVQMGKAAYNQGMTIQYCMPLPQDILQSTEIPAVTHSRVSHDYRSHWESWVVGRNSLLAWALGIFPFKDVTVTTTEQPGDPKYYTGKEMNPELLMIISALTNGPVAPGDRIQYHNKPLIMSSCRADGVLLKFDRPALAIDRSYLAVNMVKGEFWETSSTLDGLQWNYLLAANVSADFDVNLNDFYGLINVDHPRVLTNLVTKESKLFSKTDSISLKKNPEKRNHVIPYEYYLLSPVLKNDMVLLGELDKIATVSKQRFRNIVVDRQGVSVSLNTMPKEQVTVSFIVGGSKTVHATCISEDGELSVYCDVKGSFECLQQ